MRPARIKLRNVGPFLDEEIDFSRLGNLFLITGETGSGKTFIFDAMTYAIYGETCGTRGELSAASLISNTKAEKDDSLVEFTFAIGEAQYRVTRYLEKHTTPKTLTLLLEISEDGGKTFAIKSEKAAARKDIEQIVRLKKSDFSQVVLLPQGKFERFLTSSSDEKREILRKIFNVEKFTKIVDEINSGVREKKLEIDSLQSQIAAAGNGSALESLEEELEKKSKECGECEKIRADGEKKLKEFSALIAELKGKLDNANRREAAEKNLALELEKQELFDKKKFAAERARRAQLSEEALHDKERCAKAAERMAALMQEADSALKENTLRFDAAKEKEKALPGLKERINSLLIESRKFKELSVKAEELEKKSSATEAAQEKFNGAAAQLEAKRSELMEKRAALPEGKTAAECLSELNEETVRLSMSKRNCEEEKRRADSALQLEKEIARLGSDAQEEEAEFNSLSEKISSLKEKVSRAQDEKNFASLMEQAAVLAARLKEGVKCPVCGSTRHPEPAVAEEARDFDSEIAALEKELESLAKKLDGCRERLSSSKASRREKSGQLEKLGKVMPLEEAEAALNVAEKLLSENAARKESLSALASEISGLEQEAEGLAESERAAKIEFEKNSAAKEELLNFFEGGETSAKALAERCSRLELSLSEAERERDEIASEVTRATGAKEKAAANFSSAKTQLEDASKMLSEAREKFAESLASSGFESEAELSGAMMERRELEREEREIALHEKRMAEYETAVRTIEAKGTAREISEEKSKAESEMNSIEEKIRGAGEESARLGREIGILQSSVAQMKECGKKIAALQEEYKIRKYLQDIFARKTQLDTWALGAYYKNIVGFASRRFERFSNGQYTLRQNMDYSSGRANSDNSLDLLVFDSHRGIEREIKTLSGGERFEASLSLALAITDSVRYELDSIFIDEGFGTLDSKTRDKVMPILRELKETKTVGIISHVEAFQDEIPSQIRLTKTDTGSKISSLAP